MDLIEIALAFGTPAYLLLQIGTLVVARLEGWWVAFGLPLVFSVPIAGWCAFSLAQGSNLWPLPFILFAPVGCLYLLAVLVAHAVVPR